MSEHIEQVVHLTVAARLGVAVTAVRARDRFADLALHPLDIVLIALRIEDVERIELPIHRLDGVETIADLVTLVRRVQAGECYLEKPSFLPFRRRFLRSKRRASTRRLHLT